MERMREKTKAGQRWDHYPTTTKAPSAAPNVLVVLTDDVGFGACSTFGGIISTPALDQLAASGLRYNAFHTTAMCSPTRAALLTGRNHHSVGFGSISNYSIDAPGYTSVLPKSAATIAKVLRENGYDTAMFGKNHNTPEWELGPLGPYERWPLGQGFNYFYGFNAAQMDQFTPALVENINAIRPPIVADYHLDKDLADHAIHWFQVQKALRPDHPFFIYWAPGTLHEPHQAPGSWIDRYRGKFDAGWDIVRGEVFEEQRSLGIIPSDAVLTPRPEYIPAWNTLTSNTKKLYARQMEVAAAQLSHFDYQFGRVVEELRERGELDNTLIIFVQGDNGAAQEYEFGNTNTDLFGILTETPETMLPKLDKLGGTDSHGTYAPGWGWVMNTPLAESKQVASHLGGIRNGLVISWPDRIKACGEVRTQFGHVIDIAPTIYEAVGIIPPETFDGVPQRPIDGLSLVYTFDDPEAPDRHVEQYFEMLGNRGLYQHGWMASTVPPRPPFADTSGLDPATFDWALYNLSVDWSQSTDISVANPGKLHSLQVRFEEIAEQFQVYPIGNDQVARMKGDYRPHALTGTGPRLYPAGNTRYRESAFPPIGPGWKGTATVNLSAMEASGPIFSMGSKFSGAFFGVENGKPSFVLNPTGEEEHFTTICSERRLELGESKIEVSITKTQPPIAIMSINGSQVGSAEVLAFPSPMTPETFVGEFAIDQPHRALDTKFRLRSLEIEDA
jgi:arylsulfatase